MSTRTYLVLNGPNLGHIGSRQPEIYGTQTLDSLPSLLKPMLGASAEEVALLFHQSNFEGNLIDRLEKARTEGVAGIAFNAGALTHTSLAIADCLAWIGVPCVEVHLSNIFARTDEPLRQKSLMGKSCIGCVAGFGILGYALAVLALERHAKQLQDTK
ncbi:3-dehydroquinate dehydratase [Humidesulfovibrio mexicanus]|jgi:3-dehydroquinate dehydratase-2|uniref:3-dehydroquinate dehydratase n=1 Tax=Humidesulfovibrio mexicanus TaxID=147047 RepID=A0A238ZHG3_9BACT|nr:type II 3-dehydroquinate dehydratase [Humidesulfovibrio mexicanus]SNR82133.1 3-dehydroquinate dehydratase [Humidesulfovibrio mexicanus]